MAYEFLELKRELKEFQALIQEEKERIAEDARLLREWNLSQGECEVQPGPSYYRSDAHVDLVQPVPSTSGQPQQVATGNVDKIRHFWNQLQDLETACAEEKEKIRESKTLLTSIIQNSSHQIENQLTADDNIVSKVKSHPENGTDSPDPSLTSSKPKRVPPPTATFNSCTERSEAPVVRPARHIPVSSQAGSSSMGGHTQDDGLEPLRVVVEKAIKEESFSEEFKEFITSQLRFEENIRAREAYERKLEAEIAELDAFLGYDVKEQPMAYETGIREYRFANELKEFISSQLRLEENIRARQAVKTKLEAKVAEPDAFLGPDKIKKQSPAEIENPTCSGVSVDRHSLVDKHKQLPTEPHEGNLEAEVAELDAILDYDEVKKQPPAGGENPTCSRVTPFADSHSLVNKHKQLPNKAYEIKLEAEVSEQDAFLGYGKVKKHPIAEREDRLRPIATTYVDRYPLIKRHEQLPSIEEVDVDEVDAQKFDAPEVDEHEVDAHEVKGSEVEGAAVDAPQVHLPHVLEREVYVREVYASVFDAPEVDLNRFTRKIKSQHNLLNQDAKALIQIAQAKISEWDLLLDKTNKLLLQFEN